MSGGNCQGANCPRLKNVSGELPGGEMFWGMFWENVWINMQDHKSLCAVPLLLSHTDTQTAFDQVNC